MPLVIRKTDIFFNNRLDSESLFRDLTAQTLESLFRIKFTIYLQKGETIFAVADLPQRLYVLRKGRAQLLAGSEMNNERKIRSVEPNEILGLTETVANLPYETCAVAITPCEIEFINREDFINFLRKEREVCFRLARLLALNLQKSYNLLGLQTFENRFGEL